MVVRAISILLISTFLNCANIHAEDADCYGGEWQLVEILRDRWYFMGGWGPVYSYGISMGFWQGPTSCTDVEYDSEGYQLEYTKLLVCIIPAYEKINSAPTGGNCTISGKAIPDPYFPKNWNLSPCTSMEHLPPYPASGYGEVVIAYSMKKSKRICPANTFPKRNNSGEPNSCE